MKIAHEKIWISGCSGRLGTSMLRLLDPLDAEIIATDERGVDITNQEEVSHFVDRVRPHTIINCSGLSNRDKCEQNPDAAYLLNAVGARNIAIASNKYMAKLVQLSTADVFDGKSKLPYTEFDQPNPQSIYGKSKLAGENYVREFSNYHFIVRVSRLYSRENQFVEDILKEAKSGQVVVSKDLYMSPTSAHELANFLIELINTSSFGTYHTSADGFISMHDFTSEILSYTGVKADIIESSEYTSLKSRPGFFALDDYILKITGGYKIPNWKDTLHEYIDREGLNG
ncbi:MULTISPECIES: NAD(P)-dependent oxidoreductase [Anaerococcus]|jgi:dTDP-4-dehydrorhamnose reductase|uniref:dTDP-4-dehydrorhamnose reductase n=2 Tax=Anaerococcus octavius TaxID=54007 RepID=A0A2I1M3M2_9FIRM|nr:MULTISPECIES: NAD(P)-dependent oxidoreductase [Anaerococcus]MBS6106638.1 NAD(P)-dependent oxidoreductase [Anaerococcus sp.]MDU2599315.1 NAD(P)-dependent oxidoreductase [Anaerococcus sp.]MDU3177236.1 NAD(P)-dependent oxidoreductase [Anaerococcus sp.]MDU4026373.1 NAD(P)-dependent oxidoreductase [Anaerococcus sp.]MDU5230119.1 NAD(P)-dependent oxidoreductase [Anaerococcus sp.]